MSTGTNGTSERHFDGCEWNPDADRAAFESDEHHRTTAAALLVGANGQWRLCASCAALPQFKRFRVRRKIEIRGRVAP